MSRTYRRSKKVREGKREPRRLSPTEAEVNQWYEEKWVGDEEDPHEADSLEEEILLFDIPKGVGGDAVEKLIHSLEAAIKKNETRKEFQTVEEVIASLRGQQHERLSKPVSNEWIFNDIIRQTRNAKYWRYGVKKRMTAWGDLEFHAVGNNASHHWEIAYCKSEGKIIVRSQDCSTGDYHEPRFRVADGDPGYVGHW